MKLLFKILLIILFISLFGWLYVVYLYLHKENEQSLDNIKEDLKDEVKVVTKTLKKGGKEVGRVVEDLKEVVGDRQSEIVDFIKNMQKEAFEIKDIADRFKDVSERTLRRDMQKLEKSGFIKQIGSTRNSKYRIIT